MRRLTQKEMHRICVYLRAKFGELPYRERRTARRTIIRALKRRPPARVEEDPASGIRVPEESSSPALAGF